MMSPRRSLIPVLIYCEGLHDQTFVKHLHSLYGSASPQHYFDIQAGKGGSPKSLVVKANNKPGGYQFRFVVCDGDRSQKELNDASTWAARHNLSLVVLEPCLEAIMLSILEPKLKTSAWTAARYKKHIQQKYISKTNRSNLKDYDIIGRDLVDSARYRNIYLDKLIKILEAPDSSPITKPNPV